MVNLTIKSNNLEDRINAEKCKWSTRSASMNFVFNPKPMYYMIRVKVY